jgi:hypothetical protein
MGMHAVKAEWISNMQRAIAISVPDDVVVFLEEREGQDETV